MHALAFCLFFLAVICPEAAASILLARQTGVSNVSAAELAGFAPFTQFARAAYCPQGISNWKCGGPCDALPDFEPTLTGGDGNAEQYCKYWPTQHSIIVSHQGTDPTKFLSLLTDINIATGNLNATLFPGVSTDVKLYDGFRDQHALTATSILAEVKSLIASKNTSSVIVVGHSLGGALAELESLYLILNLPAGSNVQGITYGTPRVGNAAFAALIDTKVLSFRRINNKKDMIPILPDRSLGFLHPTGEVHILSPGNAVSCPGDDDAMDSICQDSTVPSVLQGNLLDHLGPYEGISIGTIYCK